MANKDIWSNRAFLIFAVEFELALGIWLISGLFRKAAWLAALLCFGLFSAITFYKAITGADSCGCFGSVKINPWITLFAIDLPAVTALLIYRPKEINAETNTKEHIATIIKIYTLIFSITLILLCKNNTAASLWNNITSENVEILLDHTWSKKTIQKGFSVVGYINHQCSKCLIVKEQLKNVAKKLYSKYPNIRFTIIELPDE